MGKKMFNWQVFLGVTLVALSALVYLIHYAIFRDAHHIFIYLIGDIAFVFFEVLLVTLLIHQLLSFREKKAMLNKLNMVIGIFFSEVGSELLRRFSFFNMDVDRINQRLKEIEKFSDKDFIKAREGLVSYPYDMDIKRGDLKALTDFLSSEKDFLLNLLGNPNLLEHDSFTNLLWSVFHLTEELLHRKSFEGLPDSDYKHLAGDIRRAYVHLIAEWIDYMHHLKNNYSYLFSLAVRTNPFNAHARVEIR